MAIWWFCILLFYLPESVSADFFEQKTWTVVDVMNDVYTDVALLYHRPNTPCSECAVRTNMLHGIAFSCHHGNRSCLIHSICHVEIPPSPGTWESRDGMRHFCSSKQFHIFLKKKEVPFKDKMNWWLLKIKKLIISICAKTDLCTHFMKDVKQKWEYHFQLSCSVLHIIRWFFLNSKKNNCETHEVMVWAVCLQKWLSQFQFFNQS